jgi:two-component system phosphate regulon sensor histidine kinase PhoR
MSGSGKVPWSGILLAAATSVALAYIGNSAWAALALFLLWAGSLWLVRPEEEPIGIRQHDAAVSRDVMREVIEPLSLPLMLFDGDRVIAANEAARAVIGGHVIGQDARIALRHPEAVRLLEHPEGSSATISGLTGARSLWQLNRLRIDDTHWLIELIDRTVEADISRAHTDFVANASHELRTPLAAIIAYVETLSDNPGSVDAEMTSRFHSTVLREAKRMQSLLIDLMSLSQLEAEKHDAPTDHIDLGQLASRVVGEFAATIGNARVNLLRPDEPIYVAGDSRQLEQLLRNLVENSLKYGDPDKPVSVTLGSAGAMAQFVVADEGAGVAAEHLPHLTRRFYRTDPGRSRAAGGTGLGLAIVKHIVERHRGKLDIDSELGVGTQVTVRLPVISPDGE